ncbi:28s ribosomal protein mitochondrial [Limosa lapponica baueri]|uniref:28s ribosomal protein mitochondrial n=1 Tax=Limosa lapponica baueri TaxID=1758121 RepID=A0A2I0TKE0_LIMLA|nr:28s ribosomal protein mitochondrial [Limosa lapponica baueri]
MTLEAIKRKQLQKYHKAPEDEKETIECNPYVIFHQALKNCQPIIGLSSVTKGGKTYQCKLFSPWRESHFAVGVKTAPRNPVQDKRSTPQALSKETEISDRQQKNWQSQDYQSHPLCSITLLG